MTQGRTRQLLAGVFACHAATKMATSVIAGSANGGRLLVAGLALTAAIQLLRPSGGHVVGMVCLVLMSIRLVWMMVEPGIPPLAGALWLASYVVTGAALVAQASGRLSKHAAKAADGALVTTLLWTMWVYGRGIAALM